MLKLKWADNKANKHFEAIKDDLLKRIKSILDGDSVTMDKVTYKIDDINEKEILEMFSTEKGLFDLITGRPAKLRSIISQISQIKDDVFSNENNLNRIFYNIFIISTYDGTKQVKYIKIPRFDKIDFVRNIGLITCPYCNRAYINTVDKNDANQTTIKPQIDHFFPKSIYPFLGMSYYNLIPSCTLCNGFDNKSSKSPIKYNADPENSILIENPYEIDLSKFLYSFERENNNYFDVNSFKVVLNFPVGFEENYEDFFGLSTLYKGHNDHVQELVVKKLKYNDISEKYATSIVESNDIHDDFERLYYGYYSKEDDFHKRPLSKFYHDILLKEDPNDK